MRGKLEINGMIKEAIIDSGAATNVMTRKLMEEMELEIEEPSNFRCTLANGMKVASLGTTTMEIGINDVLVLPIKVNIIESEDKEIIIGNDTLRDMNARIDYENKILEIKINDGKIKEIPVEYEKDIKKGTKVEIESESEEEIEPEYGEEYESENEYENQKEVYTVLKEWSENGLSDEEKQEVLAQ